MRVVGLTHGQFYSYGRRVTLGVCHAQIGISGTLLGQQCVANKSFESTSGIWIERPALTQWPEIGGPHSVLQYQLSSLGSDQALIYRLPESREKCF